MAYRKKAGAILEHNPDIVVVQECEHPEKLAFNNDTERPAQCLWFGNNRNKGLGIFSYSDFKLKVQRSHNEELKLVVPIKVYNDTTSFFLYAIWAHNPDDPDGQYVTQIWKALKHYSRALSKQNTLLIGDFNSNTIWDKPKRVGNHTHVVDYLESKKIHSTYHRHFVQEQGKEKHPTFYLYKNKKKSYHIDYCFASLNLIETLSSVEVGKFDRWMKYSDHVPLIITFNTGNDA